MPARRRFFVRFTLGVLAALLLGVVVFIGLGWVVSVHEDWLVKPLGKKRVAALWDWYLTVAGQMLPGDRDDDGWRDGIELFVMTDMSNAQSHRVSYVTLAENPPCVCLCGERSSLRWLLQMTSGRALPFPRGFQMTVAADVPVLLAKNASGPPSAGPLLVTANDRGELEFDVLASGTEPQVQITFTGTVKGAAFGGQTCLISGWRGTPQTVTFTDAQGQPLTQPPDPRTRLNSGTIFVSWPPGDVAGYLVEARAKASGAPWELKEWMEAPFKSAQWEYMDIGRAGAWQSRNRLGNFEFRLIPVNHTPP